MEYPADEQQLAELVRQAADRGQVVRPVGAGHSSVPLVTTPDVMVSVQKQKGLVRHDATARQATIRAGMTLQEAGETLLEVGLAMHNLGDVNYQMLVGAFGTGTHGTGWNLPILSAALIGVKMVTASGELVQYHADHDSEMLQACRVSLGCLGIFTELTLQLEPAYRLHRQEWCARTDDCLEHLDELVHDNRTCDFYWYPRNDLVQIRTMNPPEEGGKHIAWAAPKDETEGWSSEIIPKERKLKYEEMEYSVSAGAAVPCFQAVRERIKLRHRKHVGWRVLYRTVAGDDAMLSPSWERRTVTISLHHNAGLPYAPFFDDIEPIFLAHGGIPHWGKKHSLQAQDLRPLFPRWDRFLAIRQQLDPQGVFLNDYLRQLFGLT